MTITLEEIWKLPPKERLIALKKYQEEQKKARDEEQKKIEEAEKKIKEESEKILKKSIDEIARTEEEEEEKEKERTNKKENLEEIADEAKTKKEESNKEEVAYQSKAAQDAYLNSLAKQPAAYLLSSANELREIQTQKGYLNPTEMNKVNNLNDALYQKQKEYRGTEEAKKFMSAAEQTLEAMKDPLKNKRYI